MVADCSDDSDLRLHSARRSDEETLPLPPSAACSTGMSGGSIVAGVLRFWVARRNGARSRGIAGKSLVSSVNRLTDVRCVPRELFFGTCGRAGFAVALGWLVRPLQW
ncbi:hypothetical protein NDU88_007788 [Pleurodeles waltl]|uniref:Uncharacterized protein n=1 Tax=Pleurodeles waltl TaxID=8319 RepID=A0AAV7PUH4_PLEWA|nr:hypothetical protein NDU88_007788 [Pleurodeles waltl]